MRHGCGMRAKASETRFALRRVRSTPRSTSLQQALRFVCVAGWRSGDGGAFAFAAGVQQRALPHAAHLVALAAPLRNLREEKHVVLLA